ncbi:hypothetical protein GWK47_013525 [Chionoecetes opilio]|uniref:Uncharacterized protein n=1 Tax=Chionoecetes opilio TaxID=41210 RepID=A0A8J4XV65_CHIOP|nr:hypothetical protein GWK47_013525 [Chionoecetes opilio]
MAHKNDVDSQPGVLDQTRRHTSPLAPDCTHKLCVCHLSALPKDDDAYESAAGLRDMSTGTCQFRQRTLLRGCQGPVPCGRILNISRGQRVTLCGPSFLPRSGAHMPSLTVGVLQLLRPYGITQGFMGDCLDKLFLGGVTQSE